MWSILIKIIQKMRSLMDRRFGIIILNLVEIITESTRFVHIATKITTESTPG
jgi:hypothetical protein